MGKFSESIQDAHAQFIQRQKMFFVATAPLSANGHINLSPKGADSFRVLTHTSVIYLDMVGSGNETSAHVLENGRITFMFCAFDGPPNILRLYGNGRTILPGNAEWDTYISMFHIEGAIRQIIYADVYKVQTSCGFSVPLYDYTGERDHAVKWAAKKTPGEMEHYKTEKNSVSLDGLPSALALQPNA